MFLQFGYNFNIYNHVAKCNEENKQFVTHETINREPDLFVRCNYMYTRLQVESMYNLRLIRNHS